MSIYIAIKEIAVIDRQRKKMDKIPELAESIKEVGRLINPITVRIPDDADKENPDYKGEPYILKTGGRRLAAHMVLGKDEIEARIWDDCDPLMREIIELRENVDREGITWQEEIDAKARIHEIRKQQDPTHTAADTAEEVGEHPGNISRDLKLSRMMEADPSLRTAPSKKAAIRKAGFKADIAAKVANVKKADSDNIREKIVTADMRDYVRTLPDNSVDLCFTDFPFGIDYDLVRTKDSNVKGGYRDDPGAVRDLLADVIPEIVRVVKPTGWIACMMGFTNYPFLASLFADACVVHKGHYRADGQVFCHGTDNKQLCEFLSPEDLPWIWYRPNSRQPSLWPELHANNQYELVCVVNGGKAKLVTPNVGNVLMFDSDYKGRIHEMQRPHALCKEIIQRLTVTGEKVLDLCFGSGAHLAAAADLGRDFIGCDINAENLGPALSLIAEHYKPQVMHKKFLHRATPVSHDAPLSDLLPDFMLEED